MRPAVLIIIKALSPVHFWRAFINDNCPSKLVSTFHAYKEKNPIVIPIMVNIFAISLSNTIVQNCNTIVHDCPIINIYRNPKYIKQLYKLFYNEEIPSFNYTKVDNIYRC